MPYMMLSYEVNLHVSRSYRYDEGEDIIDIYNMLLDNPYIEDMDYRVVKAVADEFAAIPNSYDVDVRAIACPAVDPIGPDPDEHVPHWREFVPEDEIEAYRVGRAAEQMRDDLESLLVQGDYEQIATIASLLASLRKE